MKSVVKVAQNTGTAGLSADQVRRILTGAVLPPTPRSIDVLVKALGGSREDGATALQLWHKAIVEVQAPAPGRKRTKPPDPTLVVRTAEEQRFRQLVANGESIIAIVGPPGCGKSTIARMFAALDGRDAVVVDCTSALTMETDLGLALSRLQGSAQIDRWKAMATNLGKRHPRGLCVIFENADNERLVQRAVAQGVSGYVLVCSRRTLSLVGAASTIRIGGMTPDETDQLARQALEVDPNTAPSLETSDELRAAIQSASSGNPAAVIGICGHLAIAPSSEWAASLASLRTTVARILDGSDGRGELQLTAIYRGIVQQLIQSDPHAAEALQLVAFTAPTPLPSMVLVTSLARSTADEELTVARTAARAVLARLVRQHLIDVNEASLEMSTLVRQILREIWRDKQQAIIDSARRTLRAVGAVLVDKTGRKQVPENVPDLMNFIGQHLLELHSLALYGSGVKNAPRILIPAVQAAADILVSTGVDPSRFLLLQMPDGIYRYRLELKEVSSDVGIASLAATVDVAALQKWPSAKWKIDKTRQIVVGLDGTAVMHGIAFVNTGVDV